jgi:hypothetical protein
MRETKAHIVRRVNAGHRETALSILVTQRPSPLRHRLKVAHRDLGPLSAWPCQGPALGCPRGLELRLSTIYQTEMPDVSSVRHVAEQV